MNEQTRDLDEAIETILAWRSTRASAGTLRQEIRAAVEHVEQRRSPLDRLAHLSPAMRLVWLAALVGLLAALVAGTALVGSRPNLATVTTPGPTPTPSGASPSAAPAFQGFYCDPRSDAAGTGSLDLTGAWFDGANVYYLRQAGATIWGVAFNSPDASARDLSQIGPYIVLHGAKAADGTIHMDWAGAGDRYPGDPRFAGPDYPARYHAEQGTLTWKTSTGGGGDVQLTTTAETGSPLSGPLFKLPTLTACTPAVR